MEEERKKADSAVKMLESYKSIQNKYQEGGESLRVEVMRRVKAEEELAKVQQRNVNAYLVRRDWKKEFGSISVDCSPIHRADLEIMWVEAIMNLYLKVIY